MNPVRIYRVANALHWALIAFTAGLVLGTVAGWILEAVR